MCIIESFRAIKCNSENSYYFETGGTLYRTEKKNVRTLICNEILCENEKEIGIWQSILDICHGQMPVEEETINEWPENGCN